MGLRASREHCGENHQTIATRLSTDSTAFKVHATDSQLSAQVKEFIAATERSEEANSSQGSIHNSYFRLKSSKHKLNLSEEAASLQAMFDQIETLRNIDLCLTKASSNVVEVLEGLYDTSVDGGTFAGSQRAQTFSILADFLIEIEGAEVLQRFAQQCFEDYYEFNDKRMRDLTCFDWVSNTLGTMQNPIFECLLLVLSAMQNFTDFHHRFCSACAKAGVVSMCLENIQTIDAESINWENGDKHSEPVLIISTCLGILHNISQRLRDSEVFAHSEETLLRFVDAKVTRISASSLLCLAYLVVEETNHLILADENVLNFIIRMLDEAWQTKHRRSNGYSARELAEGLSHLAINDTNKTVLGHKGAVGVLIAVLRTTRANDERASALRALWMLAFDDNNKKVIRQDAGALRMLRQLQHSKDPEVQKAAAGTLWELEGKTARSVEKQEGTRNHVMISYQWDNQDVLIEVRKRLQANGYRVWMDLEQMGGSTLEAMAKAVEDSSVVLICLSQKYKESPNCRSEAEYAYQLRKDVVPLMMQHKYKADGWLGMLLGTKLWFDFRNKQGIEESMAMLVKELGRRGKDGDLADGTAEPAIRPTAADAITSEPVAAVSGWTNEEVRQWIKEVGLEKVCDEDISEMNGQTLIDLQQLRGECPEYFYRCLEQNLKLANMFDVFKFRMELAKLLEK